MIPPTPKLQLASARLSAAIERLRQVVRVEFVIYQTAIWHPSATGLDFRGAAVTGAAVLLFGAV